MEILGRRIVSQTKFNTELHTSMLKLASCPCHFFTLRNSCLHTDSPVSILSPFSTRNPMTQVHYYSKYVAKYESVCVEKKNKLDVTEWFFALIICSTCFGHIYAQHQELETTCVLLPPMVCSAWLLVFGGSGAEQQAMRPGRGMLHDSVVQHPSSWTHTLVHYT